MDILEAPQISQDEEYRFPYHYLATMPANGFAQHLVDSWGINYISSIELILKHISENIPQSLIDIGCGDGRLTRELHLRFPEVTICGADYSERAISLAKAMNQDAPRICFEQLDIANYDPAEKYESAVLMEVFEHIPLNQAENFIAGVRRVIKNGGFLYLTVPHSNKPLEYKHYQHFTIDSITRYLKPYFNILEVVTFEKAGIARKVINWLLCNRLFVLNSHKLLRFIYHFQAKFLFDCDREEQCQRLFVKAVAK